MHFEIERRFLVLHDGWRVSATTSRRLTDGVMSRTDQLKVRVRTDGSNAWLTLKSARQGITRTEQDFAIPVHMASHLIRNSCQGRIIEKTRYCVPVGSSMWSVDTFHGRFEGLVWAEIELSREGETFARPDWLGQEVSANPYFRLSSLLTTSASDAATIAAPQIIASGFPG